MLVVTGLVMLDNFDDFVERKRLEITAAEETEHYTDSDDSTPSEDDEE